MFTNITKLMAKTIIDHLDDLLQDTAIKKKFPTQHSFLKKYKSNLSKFDYHDKYAEFRNQLEKLPDSPKDSDIQNLVNIVKGALQEAYEQGMKNGVARIDERADHKEGYDKGYEKGKDEWEEKGKIEGIKEQKKKNLKENDLWVGTAILSVLLAFSIFGSCLLVSFGSDLLFTDEAPEIQGIPKSVAYEIDKLESPKNQDVFKDSPWAGISLIAMGVLLFIISNLAFAMYFARKQQQ